MNLLFVTVIFILYYYLVKLNIDLYFATDILLILNKDFPFTPAYWFYSFVIIFKKTHTLTRTSQKRPGPDQLKQLVENN